MASSSTYLLIGAGFLGVLGLQQLQRRWCVRQSRQYAEQYIAEHSLDAVVENPGQYPPSRFWRHVRKGAYWAELRFSDGRVEYLRICPSLGVPVRFDVFPSESVSQR